MNLYYWVMVGRIPLLIFLCIWLVCKRIYNRIVKKGMRTNIGHPYLNLYFCEVPQLKWSKNSECKLFWDKTWKRKKLSSCSSRNVYTRVIPYPDTLMSGTSVTWNMSPFHKYFIAFFDSVFCTCCSGFAWNVYPPPPRSTFDSLPGKLQLILKAQFKYHFLMKLSITH